MKAVSLILSAVATLTISGCKTEEEAASPQLPLISPTQFEQRYERDQIHDRLTNNYTDRTQIAPEQFSGLGQ